MFWRRVLLGGKNRPLDAFEENQQAASLVCWKERRYWPCFRRFVCLKLYFNHLNSTSGLLGSNAEVLEGELSAVGRCELAQYPWRQASLLTKLSRQICPLNNQWISLPWLSWYVLNSENRFGNKTWIHRCKKKIYIIFLEREIMGKLNSNYTKEFLSILN